MSQELRVSLEKAGLRMGEWYLAETDAAEREAIYREHLQTMVCAWREHGLEYASLCQSGFFRGSGSRWSADRVAQFAALTKRIRREHKELAEMLSDLVRALVKRD